MYRRRNEQLVEAKSIYFTNKVKKSKDDTKVLFRLIRNMIGNSGDKILPVHTCKRKLANDFSAFFTNKIFNIRSELGLTDTHTGGSVTNCFSGVPLNTFMDATEAEIILLSVYSPFDRVGIPPHNTPFPGVLMKSIGAAFFDQMTFLTSTTCVGCNIK